MCEICGRNPCHPQCPNADEVEPLCYCEECGEGIYPWQDGYIIDGKKYCEECISNAMSEFECYYSE